MLRKLLTLSCALVVISATTNTAQASISYKHYKKLTVIQQLHYWRVTSLRHQHTIHFWLSPKQRWRFDGLHPAGALIGRADLRTHKKLLRWSNRNYRQVWIKYQSSQRPSHYAEWLCIHSFEGAWNSATGNGYYGGLQMDLSFQSHYGLRLLRAKGTANNWTPLEQMQVAETAYNSGRGFGPWPNTARSCGLL